MEELLDVADADLYRRNPFRILDLPANASARDIQRRENRMQMEAKLGTRPASTSGNPLQLTPAADAEAVRAALERLRRPIERFLTEIFWFWPQGGTTDIGLAALASGNIDAAVAHWTGEGARTDPTTAEHNLAVLYHLLVLDDETAVPGGARAISPSRIETAWKKAFANWRSVIARPEFWMALDARAKALGDVRLTPALVQDIRTAFPSALLRINTRLAFAAADRNDQASVRRNIAATFAAGLGEDSSPSALREALQPVRVRLKQEMDAAKARWLSKPHRGAVVIAEMEAACKRELEVVTIVLAAIPAAASGEFSALHKSLLDSLADTMLVGQIAYTNKTNDWAEGIRILDRALAHASGEAMRERLANNIVILKKNATLGNDWCAPGYWDLPEATIDQLEAARKRMDGGDCEGALRSLIALDFAAIGKPLRRAVSHCLSMWALHEFNGAMSDYSQPTKVRDMLWSNVRANTSLIVNRPTPTMGFLHPPCPVCSGRNYTSWINFKFRDVPMWMCASCSAEDDRQLEEQKRKFRPRGAGVLARVSLASEVDPADSGVREMHASLLKACNNFGGITADVAALKRQLGVKGAERAVVEYTFEGRPEDLVCHFCTTNRPAADCAITVPVWGDMRRAPGLFGEQVTVKRGQLAIPRCQHCRDAHRNVAPATREWEGLRSRAAEDARRRSTGRALSFSRRSMAWAAVCGTLVWLPLRSQTIRLPVLDASGLGRFAPLAAGMAIAIVLATLLALVGRGHARKVAVAVTAADDAFLAATPRPKLPENIKPESSFESFPRVAWLCEHGWAFGQESQTQAGENGPQQLRKAATGLVT
jgi:hypothetical protein